jgi:hypothetical protein
LRAFDQNVINELREELQLIWAAVASHYIEGEMRLFAPSSNEVWQTNDPGFETWFGPTQIDQALAKLTIFYRNGELPNSPLFLDPIVYKRENGINTPLGSAIIWACSYGDGVKPFQEEASTASIN